METMSERASLPSQGKGLLVRALVFSLALLGVYLLADGGNSAETSTEKEDTMASLSGVKVVMIIAHENFRDEELLETREELLDAGASVTVASSSRTPATGMLGARVTPDKTLQEIRVDDYDAVIFVGGTGAHEYFSNRQALDLARQAYEKGKIVGAICIAPSILARAGILRGKKATCWSGESGTLVANGATYTGRPVERDGRIITANGPSAARQFGRALVEALSAGVTSP
ncbi:ThiJ/PfpI domain-containing protein [Spirochaeta thermophila DSM 6578]|uniref:ThiJ/PfpI domain-containing protein n=2 Tax=Winmispira thermophila TaxID=154 RepID=G0GA90_WINT7|nr:ThiJ/PfpI domain-containing protein [Spirochaeta thermophila DSM 6578]